MPVPMIRCRNRVTGAEADIPETALQHLTNWERLDQPPAGDGQDGAQTGGSATEPDLTSTGEQPAPRITKSRKAASSAATEGA